MSRIFLRSFGKFSAAVAVYNVLPYERPVCYAKAEPMRNILNDTEKLKTNGE